MVPKAIDGLCGVIAIEASTAGVTTSVACALTEPELTAMLVVPVPSVDANPAVAAVSLMVATPAAVEVQYPLCVRSCVVPSVNVPVAVNCCVVPSATLADCGLMAIETRVAAVTVRRVDALIVPDVAVRVAVPIPSLWTNPVVLIVAVPTVSLVQVTLLLRSCALPSVNVPVAVNCCVVPSAIDGFAGVTARETSAAELTVSVVDPAIDPEVAVMVALPSVRLVASP